MRLLHILLCLLLLCYAANARTLKLNVNTNTGLPSNNVYTTITDRYGYLWIATQKGVLKYDGYRFLKYDLKSGLPNDDVWNIHEDKNGRIWLLSIATDIGYIYKGKCYKTSPYPVLDIYNIINPRNFIETPQGLAFINYNLNNNFFYTSHDTLHNVAIDPLKRHVLYLLNDATIISYYNKKYYKWRVSPDGLKITPIKKVDRYLPSYACGQYLIPYPYTADSSGEVPVFDTKNRRYDPIYIQPGEKITMINHPDSSIYLTTEKNIYTFNDSLSFIQVVPNKDLTGEYPGANPVTMRQDRFWGRCISTNNEGLLIDYKAGDIRQTTGLDHKDFILIGKDANGNTICWSAGKKEICIVHGNGTIRYHSLNQLTKIRRLIPYSDEKSLLLAQEGLFWLFTDGRVVQFTTGYGRHEEGQNTADRSLFNDKVRYSAIDACFTSTSDLFIFFTNYNLAHIRFGDSVFRLNKIVDTRLPNILHLAQQKLIVAHDDNRVFIYNYHTGQKQFIPARMLNACGIEKIYGMCADSFGNIFINSNKNLLCYNLYNGRTQKMISNYVLEDALMIMAGNRLLIAAKAGIILSNIYGPSLIGKPSLYRNPKELLYKHVLSLSADSSEIIAVADNGIYHIPIALFRKGQQDVPAYKLLAQLNDTTVSVSGGDTLYVDARKNNIRFAVINPFGVGSPRYSTRLIGHDAAYIELNGSDYNISLLGKESFYSLDLEVSDDAWRSGPVRLTIFLRPLWWESRGGKRFILVMALVGAAILIAVAIYLTQRHLRNKHSKKSMQLELRNLKLALELKSIYAQINPHFIFNTLTTGLYYIKKQQSEKAYNHIASFSDLLRSFIKSSRKRYISIKEEIANLENYMNLQLARFDGRFTYRITTDGTIETDREMIPSLLLQPLVENAINHGLFHKEEPGRILIHFAKDQQQHTIICTVDDDGIGRERSKQINRQRIEAEESYGTDLTRSLIEIFNTYETTKITINYIDKQHPLTGTIVEIIIRKRP